MPKYAPANDAGEKPYVVTLSDWGKTRTKVAYATTPADARWRAWGRIGTGQYVTGVRRATPDDIALETT